MSIITISSLTKTYDGGGIEVKALRGIDLAIGRGGP